MAAAREESGLKRLLSITAVPMAVISRNFQKKALKYISKYL